MITSFAIDNFKSLKNFDLKLNEGLNILVGPNGSGKTTICQAMGLISSVISGRFPSYLMSIGGSESSMCKVDSSDDEFDGINFRCSGLVFAEDEKEKRYKLKYEYSGIIKIKESPELSKEFFTLSVLSHKTKRYNIVLNASSDDNDKIKISVRNKKLLGAHYFDQFKSKKSTFTVRKHSKIDSFFNLLVPLSYFCYVVKGDIEGMAMYNIDPSSAKLPSDVLEPYNMLYNGKNLANNLNFIHENHADGFNDIELFLNKICSRYNKIKINTSSDGFKREFAVVDGSGVSCPANGLSDGTVKTIALLVALYSSVSGMIIVEEPENYLHPWACKALIDYIRESGVVDSIVITTHSETLLNSILPEEIVVCDNTSGVTSASRINDTEVLDEIIQDSGFGCGYHYISGALGGTP